MKSEILAPYVRSWRKLLFYQPTKIRKTNGKKTFCYFVWYLNMMVRLVLPKMARNYLTYLPKPETLFLHSIVYSEVFTVLYIPHLSCKNYFVRKYTVTLWFSIKRKNSLKRSLENILILKFLTAQVLKTYFY